MARETICVTVDNPASVQAAEAWLAANRDRLDYLSENYGCGCCVDLYDLEGPADVIATVPNDLRCGGEWTTNPNSPQRPVCD